MEQITDTPKVLVIEDESPLQTAIEIKLKAQGFKVTLASSAAQAMNFMKEEIPDFIWLDLLLPGMDGLEFLQGMRREEKWKNIPVMIISVTAGQDKIKEAFDLDVIDFVVKSQYKLEEIIDKVQDFFKESRNKN